MDIKLTKSAIDKLTETGLKSFKIIISGYGWAGPTFGLAQGEPENDDSVSEASGFNFAVEKDIADSINSFDIDYRNGWLSKGFAVYPNGYRGSC